MGRPVEINAPIASKSRRRDGAVSGRLAGALASCIGGALVSRGAGLAGAVRACAAGFSTAGAASRARTSSTGRGCGTGVSIAAVAGAATGADAVAGEGRAAGACVCAVCRAEKYGAGCFSLCMNSAFAKTPQVSRPTPANAKFLPWRPTEDVSAPRRLVFSTARGARRRGEGSMPPTHAARERASGNFFHRRCQSFNIRFANDACCPVDAREGLDLRRA